MPSLTLASLNIPLVPPGTEFLDRVLPAGHFALAEFPVRPDVRISPQFDLFNSLNQSPIHQVQTLDITAASYMVPVQTLQARMIRLSARMGW